MNIPIISIIVPVYNAEKYLPKCIDSVLSQTFHDFELLLIDDGSQDNSGIICDEYVQKDFRISVFHKKNGGVSSARNVGLDNARGEWITFLDADDFIFPDALENICNDLGFTKNDLFLYGSVRLLENDKTLSMGKILDGIYANYITCIQHYAICGYVFCREIINKQNLRFIEGLAYSEDRIFIYQYVVNCKSVAVRKKQIYVYRKNLESACYSKDVLKKATHQFKAAANISQLLRQNSFLDYRHVLLKERRHMINMGFYGVVEQSFTKSDIIELIAIFKKFIGNDYSGVIFMYFLISNYLLQKRRKLINRNILLNWRKAIR